MHETDVHSGRADLDETGERFGDTFGLCDRIQRMFVLHDDIGRLRTDDPRARLAGACEHVAELVRS